MLTWESRQVLKAWRVLGARSVNGVVPLAEIHHYVDMVGCPFHTDDFIELLDCYGLEGRSDGPATPADDSDAEPSAAVALHEVTGHH